MFALLIGGLIALVCLAVVCVPFLRSSRSEREEQSTDGARAVHAWAVNEEEFLKRRQELRLAAARSLRDQAAASLGRALVNDEALEAEVMAVRQARSRRLVCPLCGASVAAGAAECQRCGAMLSQPSPPAGPSAHA
jgi:hypothetical protein